VYVHLTARGRALKEKLVPLAEEVNRIATRGVKPQDIAATRRTLAAILQNLEEHHPILFACWNYDRTRALADGSVQPDGIDLVYLDMPVEETFFRMLRTPRVRRLRDVAVVVCRVARCRTPRFIAIPVFPSRFFRHSCIYVSSEERHPRAEGPDRQARRRARVPDDRAGVDPRHPVRTTTACRPTASTYFTGGEEEPGRDEKLKLDLPPHPVERIGPTQTLSQMLADGEIDALHTARAPSSFDGSPTACSACSRLRRAGEGLLPRTKIFPIMHTVVIRRDVYERTAGSRSRC
jgi:4,5-dihydroxyphthalate decarboxylase